MRSRRLEQAPGPKGVGALTLSVQSVGVCALNSQSRGALALDDQKCGGSRFKCSKVLELSF